MKAQACRFRRTRLNDWERGIAILETFDFYDVIAIIDQTGKIIEKSPWDYDLSGGPLAYLDTEYGHN